jgi:hypothetical protein
MRAFGSAVATASMSALEGSELFAPVSRRTGPAILAAVSGSSCASVSPSHLASDGVGGCHASRPGRGRPEGFHVVVEHRLQLAEKRLHDLVALPLGQEGVHAFLELRGQGVHVRVGDGPSLIERELADVRRQGRCSERHDPAVRVAVHVDRGPGALRHRVDHRGDILELACQRVVRPVSAGAATSPVQGVDGDMGLQVRQQRTPAGVVGRSSVNDHERRPSPLDQ